MPKSSPAPFESSEPSVRPARFRAAVQRAPRALLVLVVAVGLEALGLVIAAVFALIETTKPGATIGADLFLAVFGLGVALLLVLSCRGLLLGNRWARSPVMTWQLFQIVIALTWLGSVITVGGVALLALAIIVIVGLMMPSVVAATTERANPTEA